jgi:PAS domain S-box-containing protein
VPPPTQENFHPSPLAGLRPIRSSWVGPVVIGALVVVWTFSLWTYDRQVTNSWREDRDERLELMSHLLANTVSQSIQSDLSGIQTMVRTWRNTREIPNAVERELQVNAIARRCGFVRHRVLVRQSGGGWGIVAGDRRGRSTPEYPVLASRSLSEDITVSPLEPIGEERVARMHLYAGASGERGEQIVVEAIWELTPESLLQEIGSQPWSDLEQIVWGLRSRAGEDILTLPEIETSTDPLFTDVTASPWIVWQLTLQPLASWYEAELNLRRTIWLLGGAAMALILAFLLQIEYKNKMLVRLANRSIESAAFIETILDGSEDYSIIATDLSGHIIRTNRGTDRLYGHPPGSLIGQPISLLTHPQAPSSDRLDHLLRVTLESHRYDDVVVVRRANGRMIHVQISSAVRMDAGGHPVGFVIITHDVTALLDRTVRLEQLNAQLTEQTRVAKRANRMVNEFLANMSHELRTPLNAILGYTRLVKRKTAGLIPERQLTNLQHIQDAGESLLALINDLLDLSKIEAGRMPIQCETLDLRALVTDIVSTVRPLAESQRDEIEVDAAENLPPMVSDAQHLRQILMNLVANAIKFTSKGTITVALRPGQDPETTQVLVRDTGIGIPEEQLPHIFEAFYQVNGASQPPQSGSGLGLSIVHRLVQRLGGAISVDSRLGMGTTFTLTLPRDVTALPDSKSEARESPGHEMPPLEQINE